MASLAEATLTAYGAIGVAGVLGAGLTFSVAFAATVPVHEPIKETLTRVYTWAGKAGSVALRAFYVALGFRLAYSLAVTYLHLGWREGKHSYVTRGRHRPAQVTARPWRPVLTWSVPSVEWT